jgi:hypothetical protein
LNQFSIPASIDLSTRPSSSPVVFWIVITDGNSVEQAPESRSWADVHRRQCRKIWNDVGLWPRHRFEQRIELRRQRRTELPLRV